MTASIADVNSISDTTIRLLIKFQSLWRGYRVRRNFISQNLYLSSKVFIDLCPDMSTLPRASAGVTKVYFPPELPVVFKNLGGERSKRRFLAMSKARDLCRAKGYQHLLIPAAHPYKDYNIEDKFRVHDVTPREQIALYVENQEKFTEVVREFTGFLCHSYLPDILTKTHPYQRESKIPLVRCDNIPLMIDQDKGKIALIDLGGYRVRKSPLSLTDAVECVKTVIYIFPYHFESIFDEVAKNCAEIHSERFRLTEWCKEVIHCFRNVYETHRDFIHQKMYSSTPIESPFNKDEIMKTVQIVLYEAVTANFPSLNDQKTSYFINEDLREQLIEKIVSPVIEKITEETPSPDLSIPFICARHITINYREILEIFPNKLIAEQAQHHLYHVLNALIVTKNICFINQYGNRFREPCIRIHY